MNASARPGLINRRSFARRWGPRLLVLNLVGYPIVAIIATALDVGSTSLAIPFRVIVAFISVTIIVVLASRSEWWSNSRWVLLFLGLYLLRLIYDAFIVGLPEAATALTFFVATVLIPGIAQGLAFQYMPSQARGAWLLALTGGAICLGALTLQFLFPSSRMLDPASTEGRLAFEALNPITLGHVAASTLLALLCLTTYRTVVPLRAIQIGVAAIASVCLIVAGSRGPILALGCSGFAYAVMTQRWRWVFGLSVIVGISLLSMETSVFDRFATGGEDASSLERLVIQGDAILQFLASPIYGSAYTELQSGEYPHNLIIETAMAMGVIGLLVLVVILLIALTRMRREWRERELLIPVLLVQYFIAMQLSGSIWGGAPFWVLVCTLFRSSRGSVASRQAMQQLRALRVRAPA